MGHRRRQDLLDLLDPLTLKIQELPRAVEGEVEKRTVARRLMTYPGVGPLTALAFELVIGMPQRFSSGKQIAGYLGLVPSEESSGDRRRLGQTGRADARGPRMVSRLAGRTTTFGGYGQGFRNNGMNCG